MKDDSFKEFILDQLHDLDELEARSMFGGYGVYQGDISLASFSGAGSTLKPMQRAVLFTSRWA